MMLKEEQLGVFIDFWDGTNPHHLPLMNLSIRDTSNTNWNLETSLQRIEKIFQNYDRQTIIRDLGLLIQQDNWRPQLVFCISILKLKEEEQLSLKKKLWDKLEEYRSWVIPQLTVTAFIIDLDFKSKASSILKKRQLDLDFNKLRKEEIFLELSKGNTRFEDKSSIAVNWRAGLLKLIKAKKIGHE